jgi:hypothetical protein
LFKVWLENWFVKFSIGLLSALGFIFFSFLGNELDLYLRNYVNESLYVK